MGDATASFENRENLQSVEKATRRGNYESGSDYVLEYGELRFAFNEDDFAQRVEQAAVKLDFVDAGLMPAIEGEIHGKLDRAIADVLHGAFTDSDATKTDRQQRSVAQQHRYMACAAPGELLDPLPSARRISPSVSSSTSSGGQRGPGKGKF